MSFYISHYIKCKWIKHLNEQQNELKETDNNNDDDRKQQQTQEFYHILRTSDSFDI